MVAKFSIENPVPPTPDLGARIKSLRLERGLSLAQVAAQTPLSEGTLSRIENGRSDISAQNLYPLAQVFDTDISVFFDDSAPVRHQGVRAVTRHGQGRPFHSTGLDSQVLATEISAKQMHPYVNSVRARTLDEAGGLHTHTGEEFLLVLSGQLVFYCEHYTPLLLGPGDSIYFEASCGHAYVNGPETAPDEACEFLVVNTHSPS